MKRFLILFLSLSLIPLTFAAGTSAQIDWVHPTANTDGSPLALTEIKESLVSWSRVSEPSLTVGSIRVAAPSTGVSIPNLTCGDFLFTVKTIVKTNDVSSDPSNPVMYATGITCKPNPPTGVTAR